jgi:hypothetical protein
MNWNEFSSLANDLLRRFPNQSKLGLLNEVQIIERLPMRNPICWAVIRDSLEGSGLPETNAYLVVIQTWDAASDYPTLTQSLTN